MEHKTELSNNRTLPLTKILVGIFAALLIGFLIYGTLNRPAEPDITTSLLTSSSFPVLALLAFAGGLFSFLSPCTLPILPAYFAFAFRGGRTTIAANTLSLIHI